MPYVNNGCNCNSNNPMNNVTDIVESWNVYYYNNSFKQYVYYGILLGNTVDLCNNVIYYFEPVINATYTSAVANCWAALGTAYPPGPPAPPNSVYICQNNAETSCYNCGLCGYDFNYFSSGVADAFTSISLGCGGTINVQRTNTGASTGSSFSYRGCYCCNSACDGGSTGPYDAIYWAGGTDEACTNDCTLPGSAVALHFSDTAISPCSLGGGGMFLFSKIARFTDFGFDVPLDATITGIQTKLNKKADESFTVEDSVVKLLVDHRMKGDNKAKFDSAWIDVDQEEVYGEQTDLWGLSDITPDKINSEGFGVALEIINSNSVDVPQANLNSIEMKVYYEQNGNQSYQTKTIDWDGAIYPLF